MTDLGARMLGYLRGEIQIRTDRRRSTGKQISELREGGESERRSGDD